METRDCPYCGTPCDADFVDVGVGFIQCGPYHCSGCQASEIGPYDKTFNPFKTHFQYEQQPGDRILTKRESDTGWYEPSTSPGSSANVINNQVVSHRVMQAAYKKEFTDNPLWHSKDYVDEWYENIRNG